MSAHTLWSSSALQLSWQQLHAQALPRRVMRELSTTDEGCCLCNVFMKRHGNGPRVVYKKICGGNIIRATPQKYVLMHVKTRGELSVLSKEIFGAPERQNQAMICYKGLPWPTKAAQCPRPGCRIGQLHMKQPQRRESSPHTRTSSWSSFERPTCYTGNYKRTWHRKPVSFFFSPLKFFISHENWVILHVGESAFIYSPSKVKAFQAPSHSLLPWKWPLCQKQVPAFTGRDTRSEWVLKWVKVLVFMHFLLIIKHKRAQILHTQLKFKTISNLSFPDTYLPSSFSQSPVKKARKNQGLLKTLAPIKILNS